MKYLLKRIVLLAIFTCVPAGASEKTGGIENTNYTAAASIDNSDNGNSLDLLGGVRLPLGNYMGMSANAGVSEFKGTNNYIDSSSLWAGLNFLLRKYDTGIIQAGYGYSETKYNDSLNPSTTSTDTWSLSGTYYIENVDVSASFLTGNNRDSGSFDISVITANYFLNHNLVMGLSVGGLDADGNKTLTISYQPEMFGNTTEISAFYDDNNFNSTLNLSIAYYFDTKVSLFERARKY